jgi:drug/metabolite transporter (DMT)-like permease
MGNGKVYATVVLIRLIYAGMHILTKASFNEGASTTVFVFYRHAVAAIFLLPFAYFLEIRKKQAPPLTFRLSAKIFVHGFYGYVDE